MALLIAINAVALRSRGDIPSSIEVEGDWAHGMQEAFPRESDGTKIDMDKILPLIVKLSAESNAFCQGFLGHLMIQGKYVPPDTHLGVQLLRLSAANGCPNAMAELGWRYLEGVAVEKDHQEAMHWLKKGAEADDTWAELNLATVYDFGLGEEINHRESFKLYSQAALKHEPVSMMRLGVFYSTGTIVETNAEKARQLWEGAAQRGNARAMSYLGTLKYIQAKTNQLDTNSAAESLNGRKKAPTSVTNMAVTAWLCATTTELANQKRIKLFHVDGPGSRPGIPGSGVLSRGSFFSRYGTATNYPSATLWYGRATTNDLPKALVQLFHDVAEHQLWPAKSAGRLPLFAASRTSRTSRRPVILRPRKFFAE